MRNAMDSAVQMSGKTGVVDKRKSDRMRHGLHGKGITWQKGKMEEGAVSRTSVDVTVLTIFERLNSI